MSAIITRTEILDESKGIHVAHISVDEIGYKGLIEVTYKVDKDGFLSLSKESEEVIAGIGYKLSIIKSLIKENT